MRLLNVNHVPSSPKSYTYEHQGKPYRIPWNNSIPWHSFYSSVKSFQERNGHAVSSPEQVEAYICTQIPKGWCTGSTEYRPSAPAQKPCSACGRRR